MPLTHLKVEKDKPYKLSDGRDMYLIVSPPWRKVLAVSTDAVHVAVVAPR